MAATAPWRFSSKLLSAPLAATASDDPAREIVQHADSRAAFDREILPQFDNADLPIVIGLDPQVSLGPPILAIPFVAAFSRSRPPLGGHGSIGRSRVSPIWWYRFHCIKSGRRAPARQPGQDSQGASRSSGMRFLQGGATKCPHIER